MIYYFLFKLTEFFLWEDSHKVAMQHVVYHCPPILSCSQVGEEFKIDEEGMYVLTVIIKWIFMLTIENKSSETVYVTLTIGGNGTVEKQKCVYCSW